MSEPRTFLDGRVVLHAGDCREVLRTLADNSVDSVVTDPPYHLQSIVKRFGGKNAAPAKHGTDGAFKRASAGFMSKTWDGGDIAFQTELWAEVLRVLKPGAHGLAMGGTRTFHRLVCAIEDAGADIRDCIVYTFGSGFPKSLNVSKAIDKSSGAERQIIGEDLSYYRRGNRANATFQSPGGSARLFSQEESHKILTEPATDAARDWDGWGTALKPAVELICLFRKPLSEHSIAANVQKWGTGAINVGACMVGTAPRTTHARGNVTGERGQIYGGYGLPHHESDGASSRWPANLIHDGSEEVLACFPETKSIASNRGEQSDIRGNNW